MDSPQAPTPYLVNEAKAAFPPAIVRAHARAISRLRWKKIALALTVGGFLGGAIGLLQPLPEQEVTVEVETVKPKEAAASPDSQDLVRLRDRNRRLEAMVWVLKHKQNTQSRSR